MEVLLDTNFIISCIKRKIDFTSDLEEMGFKILLPRGVFQELKDLKQKVKHDDRTAIEIALKMFESGSIKKMTLSKESVDNGLIEKGRQGFYIATLDAAIKREVKNRIIINAATNKIMIDRD